MVKNGDGTDCTGAVTYETEYALMTEDGVYILDIGKRIENLQIRKHHIQSILYREGTSVCFSNACVNKHIIYQATKAV